MPLYCIYVQITQQQDNSTMQILGKMGKGTKISWQNNNVNEGENRQRIKITHPQHLVFGWLHLPIAQVRVAARVE